LQVSLRKTFVFFVNNLKIILVFVENIEISPLLLGKLMVSSKGWRERWLFTVPAARLLDLSPTATWLLGNNMKGGNFP